MNRAKAPAHVLLLAACAWLPACGLNQAGVDPRPDTIAYPASAVMDRTGNWLLVTNSNADLRYNDGTLIALSLVRAEADRDPTKRDPSKVIEECPEVDYDEPLDPDLIQFCCRDALDPNIINCDERGYVGATPGDGSANLRIGSFAAGMVRQPLGQLNNMGEVVEMTPPSCPTLTNPECMQCAGYVSDDDRLLIGVRGDTSLTFIDIESHDAQTPPTLKCVGPATAPMAAGDFGHCDDEHRIVTDTTALASPTDDKDPPKIPLPDEPYALALDPRTGLLFVGHLSGNTARPFTGGFSLFDVAPQVQGVQPNGQTNLEKPRFIAPFPSPFSPNSIGQVGVTALNLGDDGTIYASSRYSPQVSGLGTTATCPVEFGSTREIAAFPNGATYVPPIAGSETRGIQFVDVSTDDDETTHHFREFVLQRSPPSLIRFRDQYTPTDILETCGSPTFLDKYVNSQNQVRLFVTCFADGEIYVYDPALPRLAKTFSVGRGPSGLVFDSAREVAYVVGFGDNNVSVIDLRPGSATEYHVIQRMGFPRVTPR